MPHQWVRSSVFVLGKVPANTKACGPQGLCAFSLSGGEYTAERGNER